MNETVRLSMRVISSQVGAAPLTDAERAAAARLAPEIYALLERHDLSHLLAGAGITEDKALAEKLEHKRLAAFYRCEKQSYAEKRAFALLEREGIDYLPLKGAVLRDFYPAGWMRTGADVDILVRPGEFERARAAFDGAGYKFIQKSTHDAMFISPNSVTFEIHFTTVESARAGAQDGVLERIWDYARPAEGRRYVLSDAMFYFYHIAHMAKHFSNGGCGVRPFVDIFVYSLAAAADAAARDALITEGGLERFERACAALCAVWFNGAPADALSEQMSDYVIGGGVYGSPENADSARLRRHGGRVRYFAKRLFMPPSQLKIRYPALEGRMWLFPVYEIRRWAESLTSRRTVGELRDVMDGDNYRKVDALFDSLGIN